MQEGDDLRRSFEQAYDEYLEPIFRYFAYRLNDRDRAKELTQDTFMRAWLYARSGKHIEAMRPFLYTTASNLFKNELRDRKQALSLDLLTEEYGFEVQSEDISEEERTEARLLLTKVDRLSPAYREVLLMRYVDGLPPQEIAAALGETGTNISVRIHRALKKLRELHEGTP